MTNTDPIRKRIEDDIVEIITPLCEFGLDPGRLDSVTEFPHIDKLVDYVLAQTKKDKGEL